MCPEEPPPLKQAKYDIENIEKEQLTLENFEK